VQEVLVESPVTAEFTARSLCPSEATPYTVQFNDASSVSGEEVISEWLWTINGENFVINNPRYTFAEPGTYQVSLTVFSESACNAFVSKNVSIEAQPQPDFSYTLNCAGQPIQFSNQSLAEGVEITAYNWTFAQEGTTVATAFEENPSVAFETSGLYTATLEVETSGGCSYSTSQDFNIPAAPQVAFSADRTYGGAPLTVNFTNQSSQADTYAWDFGGAGSSTEASPSFTFDTPGSYEVSLRVSNEPGCADSSRLTIEVAEPLSDVALSNLSLLSSEDEQLRLLLTLENRGTLPLSGFEISLRLDELLGISETFEDTLQIGERINYPLDFSFTSRPNQATQIRYACVTLGGIPAEERLSDNRACVNLQESFSIIPPYPNPAADALVFSVVLPEAGPITYSLIDSEGRQVQAREISQTRSGLNNVALDLSSLVDGVYLLQVGYRGQQESFRVLVQR
jgi:PKD repeat protein